jgi:hypothetical protein
LQSDPFDGRSEACVATSEPLSNVQVALKRALFVVWSEPAHH